MKGPTADPNNLNLEIRNGTVILLLEDQYAILTPDQADAISETMAKFAYEARTGRQPHTKSLIAERIKTKMTTRCSHVIKNLTEKGKKPLFIANEVVDIILSEAL